MTSSYLMQFFFRCTPANSGISQSSTSSGATDTDTAVEAIFTPERRYCNFISDSDSEIECTHSLINEEKSDPDISDTHMDNNSSIHVTPPTAIPKPVHEYSPTPLEAETTTPAKRPRFRLSTSRVRFRNTNQYHYTSGGRYVNFFYQAMKNIQLYIVFYYLLSEVAIPSETNINCFFLNLCRAFARFPLK